MGKKAEGLIWHRAVCPLDCPDACGLLVGTLGGRIERVEGDPEHPFTQGLVCPKMARYPERLYSPLRVTTPLRRTGPKGAGSFEPITWDQALNEIVQRYGRIIDRWGPQAILPYFYAGTEGVVQFHAGHAFFQRLGASRLLTTICSAAIEAGMAASLGSIPTTDIESTVHSDLIVIWGQNTIATNLHAWLFFREARRRGGRIVAIDPYANQTTRQADRHLMIRPGTDAALALGIMGVLIAEDLIDREFIDRHTVGFPALTQRAAQYPPEKVAELTGLDPEDILRLARDYGRARAPYIRLGAGPGRQIRGGMAIRTITLLPALVGALGKKGGGLTRSTSPAFALNMEALKPKDLGPPPARVINMVRLGHALTRIDDPPVKALHVYHSNPAVVAPDSGQVLAGLAREDLFTVVHELVMTDTTLYADLILPGASAFECTDLYKSYGHYYLRMARPAVPPVGQARTTLDVFHDLAARFGFAEECFKWDEEAIIRRLLITDSPYMAGITFDTLSTGRAIRVNIPENPFSSGYKTPSGRIEFHSASLAARGLDPLPDGTPSLDEEGDGQYPLQLITPPRRQFLNSTFGEVESLRAQAGHSTLMIHPEDAQSRDLHQGQAVRVFNGRGHFFTHAQLTTAVRPGVVVAEGLYWPRFMPGGLGVNQVTSQRLTDMGESCAFHCNLVEVSATTDGDVAGNV